MAGPEERGGSNGGGDLKDEDVVAVGSISNVLRRAFLDYYTSDFDKNLNAEWADDVASDTADGSIVTATDSEGREETNQDDTTTASRIAPDHPYLVLAKERVAAIDANLREKVTQASDLMALLESRRQDAAKKDEQQARELIAQGLVVKAQIPIGPSNFTLHRDELLPFGEFATSLIHARDLLQANHERMLDRSGNGPTAQIKAAKAAIQVPGYLSSTASVSIRKGMTLPKSTAPAHSSYDGNHDEDEEYVSEFVDDDAAVVPPSSSTITTTNNVSNTRKKYKPTRMSKRPPPPTLSTEAQLLNAKILTRMQSTLQFPRNPRYDKSNDSINELAPSFVVEPNPVEFTSYDMGGIYEQLVLLKNVSTMSGRCRILPPSSTFFMLASVLYPDSSGLIAPGLTCQVRVQFAPDTRADYSDSFVVMIETPSGTDIPLQVPLAAHRDPPRLSLPSTLLASCCLIGGTSTTTISCLNSGGRGRFWLVSDADWGVANVLDNIHALQAQPTTTAALSIGPFTLSPCDMDLGTGDAADLTLVYTPTVVGTESATFYIVCDNCLVKPFKVAGRGCEIDIAPVTINRVPIEATVASMGPLDRLLFAPIMTHAMATQTFQVVNHTPLALPFEWVVVDKRQHQQLTTTRHATTNHHICEEDKQGQLVSARLRVPFEIAPSTGVLGQGATATFVVKFTPTTVASFGALASLTICHVPPCCLPGAARNNGREDSAALTTVDAMQLTLEGASMPSAIHLNPWIVSFGGDTCLNRDIAAPLVMSNHGPTAVAFRWGHHSQQQHDDNDDDAIDFGGKGEMICHVAPSEGTVPAHGTCTVVVHVTPHRTGRFGFPLTCAVEASSQVVVWVQGHVPRPHIRLLAPEIDFGLVSVGNTATQVLRFQNDSATVATYRFSHVGPPGFVPLLKRTNSTDSMASSRFSFVTSSDASTTDDKPDVPHKCVLSFHPEDGTLQPGEEGVVSIVCTSGKYPERFRGSVQCEVMDAAAATCISARGEIQCPQVYLSQTKVALGTTYIGVPVTRTLALVNVSNLPAPFKWVEPLGKSKAYSVEFHPRSGTLESKQSLDVTIVFTGRAPGLTDVVFSCQVRGVLVPLGFELVTLQKGLVLSYQLVDDTVSQGTAVVVSPDAPPVGSSLPKLHFGEHVPLFARKSLHLLIRNHSGIPAKLSLEARKYNTTLPDNATMLPQASSLEPRDKAFQSESGRQYKSNQANVHQDRMLLSAGLGVALLCAPSTVSIAPWEQTVVTVTALNNMSGRYVDDIVVKLDTMPPVRLSATINVVGCPLSINPNCVGLRMHHDPRFPLLEFGILPLQADIVTRKVQVINTGPIPAKVTWKLAEYRDPDAVERVVDVTVTVGPRNLVDVRIHLHVQKDDIAVPFTVEPMERVIAKHDHANFVMTFHPQSCPVGVARALVVADAEWLHGENAAVYRPDSSLSNQSSTSSLMMGAVGKALKAVRLTNALGKAKPGGALNFKSVACVQLAVTGEIVPPALHWDKASPSRATFTTWSLHPPTHPSMFQTMQLVNRLATKLTFRLDTAGPFSIVQATAAANNHHHPLSASVVSPTSRPLAFNQHPTPSFTLGPSQSVQVHVQFHPPPTPSTITLPATSLSTAVSLSGHLGIRFSHGSVQTIALQGRVLRPQLVLAPSQFHFGRVHCERTHTIRVFLANPTEVDVHFTVHHHHHTPSPHQLQPPHPSAADDDPTVFQIATMSGTLRGPTLPLHTAGAAVPTPSPDYAAAINPPMEIVVTFAPSQPKKYKSRFRFDVVMGDGFDLVLEGEGTLVEHKQQPSGSRAVPRAAPLRHSHYMLGKVKE